MSEVELKVLKLNVYNEVAKTTAYTGAKIEGDAGAFDRIFTKEEDRLMLERFWVEACNGVTEQVKPFLYSVSENKVESTVNMNSDYRVTLKLGSSFDTTLKVSIETSLFSYFVAMLVCKWYKFTNKGDSEGYGQDAVGAMDDVMRKLYYKKKPVRVIPQ